MNTASFEWAMRVRDFDLANMAREAASAGRPVIADPIGDSPHPRDAVGRFTVSATINFKECKA